MANKSVLELAVGTGQWDAGLKKAKQALDNFTSAQGGLQQALEKDNSDMTAFIKMMGNMDSTAKTTKQQLREISNVLTDFTATYRTLTDEQKNSPFGQELANGIQTLTERAGVLRDAMDDVQLSIRNSASDTRLFDQMAQGMSVATAGFQGLTGAGKLLGIEMGNDVEVIAKLQAAMAVTNSLTTIQTALQKQSALMQGLNAAKTSLAVVAQQAYAVATGEATAAQAAFNVVANANPYVLLATAIAAVGTALWAFTSASSDAKKKEEELAKAEEEATKKAQEQRDAFVNASASAMNTASRLSSLQVAYKDANSEIEKTNILKQAQSEFKKLGIECKGVHDAQTLLIRDGEKIIEMIQLQGNVAAISAMRMEKFKESFKMLMENGYSASAAASLASYNKDVVELDDQINKMQGRINNIKGMLPTTGGGTTRGNGTTKPTTKAPSAAKAVKEKSIDDIINEQFPDIAQAESIGKSYGEQITEGILVGMAEKAQEADVNTLKNMMEVVIKNGIEGVDIPADELMSKIIGDGADIPDEYWKKLRDQINEKLKELGIEPIEIDMQTGSVSAKKKEKKKDDNSFEKEYSKIVGGVSSIASGIQQMGIEMPKEMQDILGVLTGISSIMSGITALLTLIQIDTKATAIASTTDAIIPLARGGVVHAASGFMVPGNHFSGDLVPAMLNSGEMVLNKFQQQALAGTLENGGMKNISISGHLEGETIALSVDRWGKRSGRGELAFWKNQ